MSDLTPEQMTLFKDLSKKHAYDIAMLKKAKVEFDSNDLTDREMLLSLLIVEMQNALVASIHNALDEYEDIMGTNTMYYVLGSAGLQFLYASLQELSAQEEHQMKEDLLNEMSFVLTEMDEDMGDLLAEMEIDLDDVFTPEAKDFIEKKQDDKAKNKKIKPKLSVVKGDKDE